MNDEPMGAMEAHFRAWGAKLDRLRAKVDQRVAQAKREYYEDIQELRDEIEAQLKRWGPDLKAKAGQAETEAQKTIRELRSRIEAELKGWGSEIERLKGKAERAEAEAGKLIQELRDKRKVLKKKLSELKDAGGAAWGDVRGGLGKAWEELKPALRSAIGKFR